MTGTVVGPRVEIPEGLSFATRVPQRYEKNGASQSPELGSGRRAPSHQGSVAGPVTRGEAFSLSTNAVCLRKCFRAPRVEPRFDARCVLAHTTSRGHSAQRVGFIYRYTYIYINLAFLISRFKTQSASWPLVPATPSVELVMRARRTRVRFPHELRLLQKI